MNIKNDYHLQDLKEWRKYYKHTMSGLNVCTSNDDFSQYRGELLSI